MPRLATSRVYRAFGARGAAFVGFFALAIGGIALESHLAPPTSDGLHVGSEPERSTPGGITWTFADGLPPGWTAVAATRRRDRSLLVTTRGTPGYQVFSPSRPLAPGRYRLLTRFQIARGGTNVATLDVARQRFLSSNSYTARADGQQVMTTGAPFTLRSRRRVAVVFSNPAPRTRSVFRIVEVRLRARRQ